MSIIRAVILLLLIATFTFFTGCTSSDNPVNSSTQTDTSKFIGTWVTIFDTSDIPMGTKDQKLNFWCPNGTCAETDTFLFVNDSIYSGYETGFESTYYYSDDSIYFFLPIVGTSEKVLDDVQSYNFSYDTLIFNPNSTKYRPVSIRISRTPLPPRIYK
ncbi:MAG: hypothetical protein JXK07_13390 [Spirochaetes bacterium]|nr:hypothetical protein [Spirochaetota bacterium]